MIKQIAAAMTTNRIPLELDVLNSFLKRWRSPRPYTSREGHALPTLELYQLLLLVIWIRSPKTHIRAIEDAYDQAQLDYMLLAERAKKLGSALSVPNGTGTEVESAEEVDKLAVELSRKFKIPLQKLQAQFLIACTVSLAVNILLNAILRAMEGSPDPIDDLSTEATHLTEEVLKLGTKMLPLHPQYSGGLATTIVVAWGAETDAARRRALEALMADHELKSIGREWMRGGLWWQNYLSQLGYNSRKDAETDEALDPDAVFEKVDSEGPIGRCTIL